MVTYKTANNQKKVFGNVLGVTTVSYPKTGYIDTLKQVEVITWKL
jgi:hypothetical protein